ncbi:MAG: hypothetical protein KA004_17335 [Verrucomicrobiales bacterium]|nr:hypothetical protein [Verrucomicrobiales bacterium]
MNAYLAMERDRAGNRGMHMPPPPPGQMARLQVAKKGAVLGQFTLLQALRNGEVTLEDHYWDVKGQELGRWRGA